MIDLSTELSEKAIILVPIVAVLVNEFKRLAWIISLQKKLPIFTLLSIVLGICGAYLQTIPNPIMAGVIVGLMASGIYSASKLPDVPKAPPAT